MMQFINQPTEIKACGNKEKIIQEFVGRVNSQADAISIAKMVSPEGWQEPGQTPEFDEYTVVLNGMLRVETKEEILDVCANQAIIIKKNQWVKYSTPNAGGAEYIAVCLPAFGPEIVRRDQ